MSRLSEGIPNSRRKHGDNFANLARNMGETRFNSHNLLRKFWWLILAVIGLLIIGLEIVERLPESLDSTFLYSVEVVLTVVLIGVIGALMRWLMVVLDERTRAIEILQQKHAIRSQLSMTKSVPEMAQHIARFAYATVLPEGVRLFLYDPIDDTYQPAASISASLTEIGGAEARKPKIRFSVEPCEACVARQADFPVSLYACPLVTQLQAVDGICLPLVRGAVPVGLLHFYPASGQALPPERIQLLKNVSPEVAGSLKIAIETQAREEIALAQTVNAVQLDVARDLHDTLGQNISFLRMKLASLLDLDGQLAPEIKTQIGQMYHVTNESYDLVRGTLALLKSGASTGLDNLLEAHAEVVAERSGIRISFRSEGRPETLPSRTMRQAFYIFREALSNIEKHARASQARVDLLWEDDQFSLSIVDDGQGFDPDNLPSGGHYGLRFMAERAKSLNGEFSLQSRPNEGTAILLKLPYT